MKSATQRRSILLASIGTSPGVLTNAVWALAHQEKAVVHNTRTEEVPAQERKADGVYLAEVNDCDIYLGIFGHTYGNVDSKGVSATEREYR